MNKELFLHWIPNVFLNNFVTLLVLGLLIELILFLFRVKSNQWKFYFRLLPLVKVFLNLFSYKFASWGILNQVNLLDLPDNSRTLNATVGIGKTGLFSDIGITTDAGYSYGFFDALCTLYFPSLVFVISYLLIGFAIFRLIQFISQVHKSHLDYKRSYDPYSLGNLSSKLKHELNKKRVLIEITDQKSASPYAIGIIKPKIRLPENIDQLLTANQIEAVIAHELSHIRRHDLLILPPLHLISTLFGLPISFLKMTQEKACDEWAVKKGFKREDLARALAFLTQSRNPKVTLAHPFIRKPQALVRIRNLAKMSLKARNLKLEVLYALLLAYVTYFVIISKVGTF